MTKSKPSVAYLSFDGDVSCFSFDGKAIRFRTPASLEKYLRVKTWDQGYLVVDATYHGEPEVIEEYIDLVPIPEKLYIDPKTFCEPIREVGIK